MSIEQTSAEFGRLRELLSDIAGAWWQEWTTLAGRLQPVLLPKTALTMLSFSSDEIVVQRGEGPTGCIDLSERLEGYSISSALRAQMDGGADVSIRLAPKDVLRVNLKLPKASPRLLRQALQFELVRVSPVDPAQLYFDFEIWSARESGEAELAVRMVRRATVDRAMTLCRAAGLSIAELYFGDDPRPAQWRAVPIDRAAHLRSLWQRWGALALTGVAASLTLLLLLSVYARGVANAADLTGRSEALRDKAVVVEHLKGKIEAMAQQQSLLTAERQKPLLVGALAELSRILPDDTWIIALQTTGKKIRLEGYSRSASHLIARLDASRLFANAQFQAPLTQDGATNTERFDLATELRR